MTEEERAALWRQQRRSREQWARDNAVRMRGDPDAATAVRAAWDPVIQANRARHTIEPEPKERHDHRVWTPA